MMTYTLRSVYAAANLQFKSEITLRSGETRIQIVSSRELPTSAHEVIDVLPDGKLEVRVSTLSRKHAGNPLLLEIVASCTAADDATPSDIRPILESLTAKAASLMTWSWPGVMGAKLGDAQFVRSAGEDTWTWFEDEAIHVTDCYESPEKMSAALAEIELKMSALPLIEQQRAAEAALRWWRHSHDVEAPPDRLIAYWIILEIISSARHSTGSIHEKVCELLHDVYPELAVVDDGRLIRRLEKVLSAARNRAVHGGKRDVADPNAMTQIARHAAMAGITFLLDGTVASTPSKELLKRIGVTVL